MVCQEVILHFALFLVYIVCFTVLAWRSVDWFFRVYGPFTDYQKKSPTDDRIDAVLYAGQQLQKKCNAAKQAAKEAKDTLRKLENMLHSSKKKSRLLSIEVIDEERDRILSEIRISNAKIRRIQSELNKLRFHNFIYNLWLVLKINIVMKLMRLKHSVRVILLSVSWSRPCKSNREQPKTASAITKSCESGIYVDASEQFVSINVTKQKKGDEYEKEMFICRPLNCTADYLCTMTESDSEEFPPLYSARFEREE